MIVSVVLLRHQQLPTLGAPIASPQKSYDAAWLRYERIENKTARARYASLPAAVVALGDSPVLKSAQREVIRGIRSMVGRTLRGEEELPAENAIVLGTHDAVSRALPDIGAISDLVDDGYLIRTVDANGQKNLVITAHNDRGVLYGAFALLRKIGLEEPCDNLNEQHAPFVPLRLLNQHDRLDGTVERGYAGPSLFWEDRGATKDLDRARDYARLLASVGLNGATVNDASVGSELMSQEGLPQLAAVAEVLRPWGLRLFVAIDMAGIRECAGLAPDAAFDQPAAQRWSANVQEVYKTVPDLGGFVLTGHRQIATGAASDGASADSPPAADPEPAVINRVADPLKAHGGVLFYRVANGGPSIVSGGKKHDPGMTAFLRFHGLDGQFDDNVILQVPAGPLEAHWRQPPSPLLGALGRTNQAIEFDLCQQSSGQQRHVCFLIPAWKATLDFDMHVGDAGTPVKNLIAGRVLEKVARQTGRAREKQEEEAETSVASDGDGEQASASNSGPEDGTDAGGREAARDVPRGGFVVEANAGRDAYWLCHPLAAANLYGFGRLAWNPDLSGKTIAEEWGRLTFGHDPLVVGTIVELLLQSWQVFESYTGPLGLGTLTDHETIGYGPNLSAVDSSAAALRHGATETSIGVDRTAATGTGFVAQYHPPVAKVFETLATTPDELLLFLHHVPYTHKLKSGRTVIQHIYNSHYDGARNANRMVEKWQALEGRIDDQRHRDVLDRLNYQAAHAQAWRDAVCRWFLRKSGIADDEGRVGNWPGRFEAEVMQLDGYEAKNVTPWETASGGQCATSVAPTGKGAVSFQYDGEPGWYDLSVCYFDENDGASTFQLLVAGEVVDEWVADDRLPDNEPNGHTSTRHVTRSIALRKGDEIRIVAMADGRERAAIDYVEISAVRDRD